MATPPGAAGSVPRVGLGALMRLAAPILVAQLAVIGLSVVDTVMAGRLSATDLAGVAVASSIFAGIYVSFIGVLQALTPIAGHHYGAGRFAEIGRDLGQALWLALFLSAAGVAVLTWTDPWIRLAGAQAEVAGIASRYLQAIALGLPAALGTRAFVALNSAVSRPQVTMAIQLVAFSAKIPLNLVFMYGAGPIDAQGGAGCGTATAVLSFLTLALSYAYWRFDPYFARFRPHAMTGPRWSRQRELLALGLPSGGSLLVEVTSFTFIAILVARFGAQTVAGHQIVANVVSVLYMAPVAIGISSGVLVAQSLGAGSPLAARRAAYSGARFAAACAVVSVLVVWILRDALVAGYTTDPAVARVALDLLALACVFHLLDAVQGVAGFVLRGYKVALAPMLIHGASLWGVGLAGGYVLVFETPVGPALGGAYTFWLAAVTGLAITAVGLGWLAANVAQAAVRDARTTADKKGPDVSGP
jgi:MATE family multidrug resistance protein